MKKRQIAAVLAGIMAMSLAVPAMAADETEGEEVKLLIAAAASLEYSMEEKLIPLFEEQNPGVKVEGSYDSSGKLQTQIEEGMEADLFFSAATKQMDVLTEEGYMKEDSEADLLENKIVAIVPKDSTLELNSFEDLANAETVALGDPDSVPAGQYDYIRKDYRPSLEWYEILFAVAIAAAAAVMPCIGVINQYKMKKERRQSLNYHFSYRGSSDFKYDVVNDMFINKMVTQRRIPRNTGGSGPGGRGPGSSVGRTTLHRSSSGRMHGGGGRKF